MITFLSVPIDSGVASWPAPARPRTRWEYRPFEDGAVETLRASAGYSRLLATLLVQRGITEPDDASHFLNPTLAGLHDPYLMKGMGVAAERIRRAIAGSEKILLYGDYDVDGTMSVVLLRAAIELAGGAADFHVPHRVHEGYGMREEIVERASADGVALLISVDNGIRERAVVERARELGIDSIVTDHHLPEEELPPALAVLNPNQPDCGYPDKNLCGAGVAFKLAQALLGGLGWDAAKLTRVTESLLKIVAIATIADLVPLSGENRIFVRHGLEGLRQPKHAGLRALLDVAGVRPGKLPTTTEVAFRIAPRLNAAGRMDSAREVIELFSTQEPARALAVAQKLDDLNAHRQRTEEEIVAGILEELDPLPSTADAPILVVDGDGWHAGVIGIVASRLVERFHRPALVLSRDAAKGTATGSGRSIPGFHLLEALESAAPLFERFGGHRQAAGCTLTIERIPELRRLLIEHAARVLGPEDFVPTLMLDAEILLRDVNNSTMREIDQLEPFGIGNPAPRFSASSLELCAPPRRLKEKHLKLWLAHEGARLAAVGWRMGDRFDEIANGSRIDAAFSIEPDTYNGGWQLNLRDLRPAGLT